MSDKKSEMIQELYDALNVDIQDLIENSDKVKSTVELKYLRCVELLDKWLSEYKKISPDFKLKNRLKSRQGVRRG